MAEEKIQLDIVGLSYSQGQAGAYALMLAETEGNRKLPIVIGAPEAQAIAIELEGMTPSRPLTHDLFRNFCTTFSIDMKEVVIHKLKEGIFYAKLVCQEGEDIREIDSRSSDAIALAVRFKCPIFTTSEIMNSAGFIGEEAQKGIESEQSPGPVNQPKPKAKSPANKVNLEELEEKLKTALEQEDYETASQLRDAIQALKDRDQE